MEQSRNSLERLSAIVDELVDAINKQKVDFETALAAEKAKTAEILENVRTLTLEKEKLQEELAGAQNNTESENKITQLQTEIESRDCKLANLYTEVQNLNDLLTNRQAQFDAVTLQKEELAGKCAAAEQKLAELQQTITQTSENIDDVVAKLEKVLEENGAGSNNN